MNVAEFCVGQISLTAWREGKRLSPGCRPAMLGIAYLIRNRVESGWQNGDWMKILSDMPIHSAEEIAEQDWRSLPDIYDKDFLWLHSQTMMIYDRTLQDDVTCGAAVDWAVHEASKPKTVKRKGLFYCNLRFPMRPWFLEKIVHMPNEHPRQATAGEISFFG